MGRLRAFEVLVEVARNEGSARKAQALATSPADVTRQISGLDAHLHTRLL
jgi:DNA-binding transcriptional LysR family regulator